MSRLLVFALLVRMHAFCAQACTRAHDCTKKDCCKKLNGRQAPPSGEPCPWKPCQARAVNSCKPQPNPNSSIVDKHAHDNVGISPRHTAHEETALTALASLSARARVWTLPGCAWAPTGRQPQEPRQLRTCVGPLWTPPGRAWAPTGRHPQEPRQLRTRVCTRRTPPTMLIIHDRARLPQMLLLDWDAPGKIP